MKRSSGRRVADDHGPRCDLGLAKGALELLARVGAQVLLEAADHGARRMGVVWIGANRDELAACDSGQRGRESQGVTAALTIIDADNDLLEHRLSSK
jgi:hypothetical protein